MLRALWIRRSARRQSKKDHAQIRGEVQLWIAEAQEKGEFIGRSEDCVYALVLPSDNYFLSRHPRMRARGLEVADAEFHGIMRSLRDTMKYPQQATRALDGTL